MSFEAHLPWDYTVNPNEIVLFGLSLALSDYLKTPKIKMIEIYDPGNIIYKYL